MKSLISNFKNTMSFLDGHKLQYSIGIIGKTIVEASAVLLESYLLKIFLDVGTADSMRTIFRLLLLVVLYVTVILLLSPLFTFYFNGNAKYGHGNINKAIYHKYGSLKEEYIEKTHSGELMSLILNDTWVVASIFMRHFRRVVAAVITIIIYMIPMFVLDWRITLIIVALNILTLAVNSQVAKTLKKSTKAIQEKMEDMTVTITNIISGMSILRIYQQTKRLHKTFAEANGTLASLEKRKAVVSSGLAAYNYAVYIINIIVFLIIGSYMVENGMTTFGAILSIMSLQTAMDVNFREFGEYYPQFFQGLAATERVCDFLKMEEEPESWIDNTINNGTENNKSGYVVFENVDFAYSNGKQVLSDFNMVIQKGEHVTLTGTSGSGKSSIAKLLLGYYPVDAGSIYIDGINSSKMNLNELRKYISYVPQEPAIFAESIMENIRYGNSSASDDEVIEAAKKAHAYTFIMEQENGFYTMAGEGGIKLSGGQKQRIALARAILKDSPILLLDEATSALDNESEQIILNILSQLGKEKTIISIAHSKECVENTERKIYIKS